MAGNRDVPDEGAFMILNIAVLATDGLAAKALAPALIKAPEVRFRSAHCRNKAGASELPDRFDTAPLNKSHSEQAICDGDLPEIDRYESPANANLPWKAVSA